MTEYEEYYDEAAREIEDSEESSENEEATQPKPDVELATPATKQPNEFEQVVKRLKEDKKTTKDKYYSSGRLAGKYFMKTALYRDIRYAIERFVGIEEVGEIEARFVSDDEVLGKYFVKVFDADLYLATEADSANELVKYYVSGWLDFIKEAWDTIKTKV